MQIDLRVLELLSSKLCHDLVSPVSAINNGVELIEEIGGSVVEEAMKLIGNSADHAARRLKLFRMAYGRAGSEENLSIRDARQVAMGYVEGGKITLHWPEEALAESLAAQRGALKTLINLVILGEEVLAYGGTLTLHGAATPDLFGCRLEITGRNAQLTPSFQDALTGVTLVEELTPRSIQPYITGKFAAFFGLTLRHEHPAPDRLDIILGKVAE